MNPHDPGTSDGSGDPGTAGRDPEILDAYRRLGGAATPVGDPLPGVQRGIRRRRATRRVLVGAAGLAVVAGVGATAVLGGGGGDDLVAVDEPASSASAAPTSEPAPAGPVSSLGFEQADGTRHTFEVGTLQVTCSRVGKPGETLLLSTAEPVVAPGDDGKLLEPLVYIEVATADLDLPRTFDLPLPDEPPRPPVLLFFAADGDGDRNNELSSAETGTSGTVTVEQASCGSTPELSLSVDAVLGSEVEQPAMTLTGDYRSGG